MFSMSRTNEIWVNLTLSVLSILRVDIDDGKGRRFASRHAVTSGVETSD
jgi:hypothetical protein